MEFPKMIYLGGEHGADHRIVADKAAQDAAKDDGFVPLGTALEGRAPDGEKAELITKLEAAEIKFDKRWNVEKLRAALEGKPE